MGYRMMTSRTVNQKTNGSNSRLIETICDLSDPEVALFHRESFFN
jgi:hypothetical protein